MCYQLTERYGACDCDYYTHAVDGCPSFGIPGHPVKLRTIWVGYACPKHSSELGRLEWYRNAANNAVVVDSGIWPTSFGASTLAPSSPSSSGSTFWTDILAAESAARANRNGMHPHPHPHHHQHGHHHIHKHDHGHDHDHDRIFDIPNTVRGRDFPALDIRIGPSSAMEHDDATPDIELDMDIDLNLIDLGVDMGRPRRRPSNVWPISGGRARPGHFMT